jgi:formiminoglutamase
MIHKPFDPSLWQGRTDGESTGPLRWHEVVCSPELLQPGDLALIGFACDAGVVRNEGRAGAARGPSAIRPMLANLPLRSVEHVVDAGDVVCDDDLEAAQVAYAASVRALLDADAHVIGLGGGHEIAYASFCALAVHLDKSDTRHSIGIVNLDAHFDLRPAPPATSGTPFFQIEQHCRQIATPFHYFCLGISEYSNTRALFERAKSFDVRYVIDEQLRQPLGSTLAELRRFCDSVEAVYLTICLDVLPAHVAPGVSAPAAAGVELSVVEALIDEVIESGRVKLADIAELNPRFDIDGRTARVAARLVARVARGLVFGTARSSAG